MNAPFKPFTANLFEANSLQAEYLHAVFAGKSLCVRVPHFISDAQCIANSTAIEADVRRSEYAGAPGLGCIAMPLYDIPFVEDGWEKYWQQHHAVFDQTRNTCSPYIYPIDLLRLKLGEIWPKACDLLKIGGRIAFAGLPRFIASAGLIEPHQDVLAWDIPNLIEAHDIVAQCAANIFLKTADSGGELELYNVRLSFAEEQARRVPNSYALDRAQLPPPVLRVKPASGDLILFDSGKVHSVAAVSGGATRITASAFIGLTRDGRLVLWS